MRRHAFGARFGLGRLEGFLSLNAIDRDVLIERLYDLLVSETKIDRSRFTADATLESLEVQSIDMVMILMAIEEKFGVYIPIDSALSEATNVASFVDGVAGQILQQRA
jgi:acyl carrier protein